MNKTLNKMNLLTIELIANCVLFAWFIVELEPLQMVLEKLAEKSGIFNTVFYPILSCWYCLTFWLTLIFVLTGFELSDKIIIPVLGAFIAFYLNKFLHVRR